MARSLMVSNLENNPVTFRAGLCLLHGLVYAPQLTCLRLGYPMHEVSNWGADYYLRVWPNPDGRDDFLFECAKAKYTLEQVLAKKDLRRIKRLDGLPLKSLSSAEYEVLQSRRKSDDHREECATEVAYFEKYNRTRPEPCNLYQMPKWMRRRFFILADVGFLLYGPFFDVPDRLCCTGGTAWCVCVGVGGAHHA